ncbi:hypothetical protein COU37_01785 [Candidatus Micrarchaeota archaeon CG10_big_fil_rev_8_21_14_0_10_45_29]|nr:MAG: hypothetical protein COU37_01785 [Candidatus Micrarchaeota archaeon CG10_big_fil_rev_8_21_14_0_10_45_29]
MDLKALFNLYKNVVLKPKPTFANEAKKENLKIMDGYKHFLIGGAIYSVFFIPYYLLMQSLSSAFSSSAIAAKTMISFPVTIVLNLLTILIGPFITVGIYYVIAAILGGKCKFNKLFYLVSLYTAPFLIITSILLYLNLIPCLGALILLAVVLYGFYVLTIAIKSAYKFSTLKAVVVWLVPTLVMVVISFAAGMYFAAKALGI